MTEEEVKLFETPDLEELQRNWPRIALRASVLVVVPVLIVWLAKTVGLYATLRSLPLPLDFLDVGPFAFEAKAIFAIAALFLGLAYLVPKRTPALVMAVCVGGILWSGHVFIQLQWARLFATQFNFRTELVPGPAAWVFAALLLAAGVAYLLLENLLEMRAQQEARKLDLEATRELASVGARTLGLMFAIGLGISVALAGAYVGMRALLTQTTLPFRLNPVFVLFGMGVCLAVLVALAARKRSPVTATRPPPGSP